VVLSGRVTRKAPGVWCPIDRLSEMALPTLMKKVARHALGVVGDTRKKELPQRHGGAEKRKVSRRG